MKALWLIRRDLLTELGGDTIQILSTAEALRARGHEIELVESERAAADADCDLVHLFHLDRLWEHLPLLRHRRARRVPIALSTIWWPTEEFDARGRAGVQGWLARSFGARAYPTLKVWQRSVSSWLRAGLAPGALPPRTFARGARELLEHVSVLLPNSRAEEAELRRRFDGAGEAVVVPNAADAEFFTPVDGVERKGVVCVGRLEPRKNQLSLIEALRGLDEPLTLIGQAGRFSGGYAARCRRWAGEHVELTGPLDREGVRERLRRARVHVAPSWYETPGLASMEAALCGCRLVVTPGGCTEEYFGDAARYASPDDPASLRAAVEAALQGPEKENARERIAREFGWSRAAERTEEAYERALAGCSA